MIEVLFDGSSPEFSEDYTPLAARLNLQGTYQLSDTGKEKKQEKKQANGIRELVLRFYTCTRGRVYTLTESNASPSQNAESPIKNGKMAVSEENTVKFRKVNPPPCITSPEYNPPNIKWKKPSKNELPRLQEGQTWLVAFYCDDVMNWEGWVVRGREFVVCVDGARGQTNQKAW